YFSEFVKTLSTKTSTEIDMELHSCSLGPEDDVGARVLMALLEWIVVELKAGTNFELVQAILARLMHAHGETLSERDELKVVLAVIVEEQRNVWERMRGVVG